MPHESGQLWLTDSFSKDALVRAVLLSDRLFLPWEEWQLFDLIGDDDDVKEALEACFARDRLVLLSQANVGTWTERLGRAQPDFEKWCIYFAKAMMQAFVANEVEYEMHECGHRITFAWDNGHGIFPPSFFPDSVTAPCRLAFGNKDATARVEDIVREYYRSLDGRVALGAAYVESAAEAFAEKKLLLDCAASWMANELSDYSDGALIVRSKNEVMWLRGMLSDGIEFRPESADDILSVVDASLARTVAPIELSSINMHRLLDLCDDMSDARLAFMDQLRSWTIQLSAIADPDERRAKLREIRDTEVLPALREYNAQAKGRWSNSIASISVSDWATFMIAGFAAANVSFATSMGVPPAVTAAIGGAALAKATLSAGLTAAKSVLEQQNTRQKSWPAFAAALADRLSVVA